MPETRILGETEIYVDIGSTLNLTCTVSFSPEPTEFIFWYHNGTVSTQQRSCSGIAMERSVVSSYLTVAHTLVRQRNGYLLTYLIFWYSKNGQYLLLRVMIDGNDVRYFVLNLAFREECC